MNKLNNLDLFYNPFNLETASLAWNSAKNPIATRVFETIRNAAYDLYINNPYKLTIGNINKITTLNASLTLPQKIASGALISLGSCYSAILYGLSFYTLGGYLHSAGELIKSPLLTATADKISFVGEKMFLTGAVPIYAVSYVIPKYLIQNTPKALHQLVSFINKIALWTFTHIISPILQAAHRVIIKAITLISAVMRTIASAVTKLATWIFSHVISPLLQAAHRVITKAITLINAVMRTIASAVTKLATWTFTHIISPFLQAAHRIITKAITLISAAIRNIASSVTKIANWIFSHLISPVFQTIYKGFLATFNKITQITASLLQKIEIAALWIFKRIVTPVSNGIIFIAKQLMNYVVYPITNTLHTGLKILASKLSQCIQIIFKNVIAPTAEAVNKIIYKVAAHTYHLLTIIQNSLADVFLKIEKIFRKTQTRITFLA